MGIGVVGAVDAGIDGLVGAVLGVDQSRVDVQVSGGVAPAEQTVVDDTGDFGTLGGSRGLLLDEGGHDDHLPDGVFTAGDIGVQGIDLAAHFLGELHVKVVQHLFQHLSGGGILVEFVGVREQEALQTVLVAPFHVLQEPVVIQLAVGGVGPDVHGGADLVLLEQIENLAAGIAFGDGQLDHLPAGSGGHEVDQGVIVIAGIQIVNAGLNILLGVGNGGVEVEQALVADEARVVELVGDVLHGVGFVDGDGDRLVLPAEGQHVGGADPQHPSGGDADGQDQSQPHEGHQNVGDAQQTFALFPLGTALPGGTLVGGDPVLRGRSVEHLVKFLAVVPVFLVVDIVLLLLRFHGQGKFRIVQNAHIEGRLRLVVAQHPMEIHGAVVRGDLLPHLGRGQAAVGAVWGFRRVVLIHVGDPVHEIPPVGGGVLRKGDLLGKGFLLRLFRL